MFAAIVSAACLAPVPTHLMPKEPDPIVPGFRWLFVCGDCGYDLEVVRVDGETITYRCVNVPEMCWQRSGDQPACGVWSVQTRKTTLDEWQKYGAPVRRYKPLESPEW